MINFFPLEFILNQTQVEILVFPTTTHCNYLSNLTIISPIIIVHK